MISVKSTGFAIREVFDLNLIHPIRRRNLYPNSPHHFFDPSESDEWNSAIHFTAFDGDIHFGCVTLIREPAHNCDFRIRWLGVDQERRSMGVGCALIEMCLIHAKEAGIWCNVRISAEKPYLELGFEKTGSVFDLPGIGDHFLMRHLRKSNLTA